MTLPLLPPLSTLVVGPSSWQGAARATPSDNTTEPGDQLRLTPLPGEACTKGGGGGSGGDGGVVGRRAPELEVVVEVVVVMRSQRRQRLSPVYPRAFPHFINK